MNGNFENNSTWSLYHYFKLMLILFWICENLYLIYFLQTIRTSPIKLLAIFFTLKNQANSLTINRGFKTNACPVISFYKKTQLNRSIWNSIYFADCITFKNCNNSVQTKLKIHVTNIANWQHHKYFSSQ